MFFRKQDKGVVFEKNKLLHISINPFERNYSLYKPNSSWSIVPIKLRCFYSPCHHINIKE